MVVMKFLSGLRFVGNSTISCQNLTQFMYIFALQPTCFCCIQQRKSAKYDPIFTSKTRKCSPGSEQSQYIQCACVPASLWHHLRHLSWQPACLLVKASRRNSPQEVNRLHSLSMRAYIIKLLVKCRAKVGPYTADKGDLIKTPLSEWPVPSFL